MLLEVKDLPAFVSALRHHQQYPGICIAAHVGSTKGVREEAKNSILTYLEAEVSRLKGELSSPGIVGRKKLERQLKQCEERLSGDHIALSVLQLIGVCGFDALQTRGPRDQTFYRRLHRFREELGRSVSIVCSDSHRVEDMFAYCDETMGDRLIPYIKLSGVPGAMSAQNLFQEIRDKGLRYGETRTTHVTPHYATSWIQGVEIVRDAREATQFWPFMTLDGPVKGDDKLAIQRFTIPLSRNLNCVIGGRGSGKSALIEALAFTCNPEPFDEKANQKDEDWYSRARATLRGCRVRLCWRLLDSDHADLPRDALFIHRYFDVGGKHAAPILTNADDKELLPGSIARPRVQLFRIHDIEEAAQPEKLRALFDNICGVEIASLAENIDQLLRQLAAQREKMVGVAAKVADLTKEHSPVRQYARRKREYEAVNQPEIREQYQTIDDVHAAETVATDIQEQWRGVYEQLDVTGNKARVASFFDDAHNALIVASDPTEQPANSDTADAPTDTTQKAEIRLYCAPLALAIESVAGDGEKKTAARDRILASLDTLGNESVQLATSLESTTKGIAATHKEARDALAAKGLPTGSAERQAKKAALEAAENDFRKYVDLWQQWDTLAQERFALFERLKAACVKRTETRKSTAEMITKRLASDLDPSVLQIQADARPIADTTRFVAWFVDNVRWERAQHKEKRFEELAKKVTPETLRRQLLSKSGHDFNTLVVDKPKTSDGRISLDDARTIVQVAAGLRQLEPELGADEDEAFLESLPNEVKEGLWAFPVQDDSTSGALQVAAVLKLDEVVLDDLPEILLNDRPQEMKRPRPLGRLSPGQRCSAILPILLLNGTAPLIIDQPEDNLDNRLIRQVIVNVLASIKLRRQVIVATHNPNLPVLGDAEQIIVLRAVEDEQCAMETTGALDDQDVVHCITEIMEGGREAFQYRQSIYQMHWTGGADDIAESTMGEDSVTETTVPPPRQAPVAEHVVAE